MHYAVTSHRPHNVQAAPGIVRANVPKIKAKELFCYFYICNFLVYNSGKPISLHRFLDNYIKHLATDNCKNMYKGGATMKRKLSKCFKAILTSCMALSFWIPCTSACLLFFGEYPVPNEEDFS